MIVRVRVVLKRTVVGDRRFDNLSESHLQSQVKEKYLSVDDLITEIGPSNGIGKLSHDGIG